MHIKKTYSTFEMAWWTRFETFLFLAIIIVWVAAFYFFDLNWLKIPWTPLALIGTAVAFVIDNKAYVGTGQGDNPYFGDFWMYDMSTNTWTTVTDSKGTFSSTALAPKHR